jgi:glycosyltransferase involved in cell wall biosynthesis
VYTTLYDAKATGDLVAPQRVRPSFLARLPGANRYFRYLAPLYPAAVESFDLRPYDTIVSSTTSWAKGVIVPPGATHVCYINTVSRFTFAYDAYVGGLAGGRGLLARGARPLVRRLVEWDRRAAARPTAFVANSRNVADRVLRHYGRESRVLFAPVDLARFAVGAGRGDYFLVVSRLLPYKRIDVAIAGCARAGVPLRIVGSGPAEAALRAAARGTNTQFCGALPDAELNALMGDARAVILPGEEDYGLVPIEAAATGRPTIAYGRGGVLETMVRGVTGDYFEELDAASLAAAIARFDAPRYAPAALRAHAETFAPERFIAKLRAIVAEVRAASGSGERPE